MCHPRSSSVASDALVVALLASLAAVAFVGGCDGGSDSGALSCTPYQIKDGDLYWWCGGECSSWEYQREATAEDYQKYCQVSQLSRSTALVLTGGLRLVSAQYLEIPVGG
jgi:hypothetical protein